VTKRTFRQAGATLVEVLLVAVLLSVGLLGLGVLQAGSLRAQAASGNRTLALALAGNALERAWAAALRGEPVAGRTFYDRNGQPAGAGPPFFTLVLTRTPLATVPAAGPGGLCALRAEVAWRDSAMAGGSLALARLMRIGG
jgi:Tfp pilus assembly protein PilV